MQLARDFQMRLRRAATLKASYWVAMIALIAGAIVARAVTSFVPNRGDDVAAAKSLGIVSVSILENHSKSADLLAYALAMAGALAISLTIWIAWAMRAGRSDFPAPAPARWRTPRTSWIEFAIVTLVAFGLFARFWNGRAATYSSWCVLVEEGEMLAWIDTVLRGGVLSRDVFCLYGPLSMWPVAALFSIFGPSLGLWRLWIFALNAPALIAIYFLLRGITRTRIAAGVGATIVAVLCAPAIPAMSWSLARVGLGMAAFAAFTRALDRGTIGWYIGTGTLIGASLLYSQEVGIACALAIGVILLVREVKRPISILWTALGAAVVIIPAAIYLAANHALGATIENLFLFPRIRMLGFAAYPFPQLAPNVDSMRAYFVPVVLAVCAFSAGTKLLRGLRDARVFVEVGLFIFGAVIFTAPLSRPEETHFLFAAPPALALLTALFEDACFALRSRRFGAAPVVALLFGASMLAIWSPIALTNLSDLIKPPSGRALDLPRGGSALLPNDFAQDLDLITREIQSRTAPNEPFWAFPNEAFLYFLADRPQPTHFPQALLAVTRAQREQLVADLERTRPRWAVVYLDAPEIDRIPYDVAIPEVVACLAANYEPESNVGAFALMRRKN